MAYPLQVVQFVKRHIGESDYSFKFKDEEYDPIRLSSFIIKELKRGAELRLGVPPDSITQAVITVPAYFGDRERRATIQAGELAGLEVLKIINEPTAAAVAYGLNQRGKKKRCLVFDLGGGTFDVTIIDIDGNRIRVRATDGNHKLGGKDWDDRLMKYVASKFQEAHGFDPLSDPLAEHDLRGRCVSAKLTLTMRPEVRIDFRHEGRLLRLNITREIFEQLTSDLLNECEQLTRSSLQEANYTIHDIDTVLLVGGSTRMPMVRQRIREMFETEPSTEINPDECVALGAALTAALEAAARQGERPPVDIKTQDVSPQSLGMVVQQKGELYNSVVVRKNTPIPCKIAKENLFTLHDGQTMLDLWLLQGDSRAPQDCQNLGHFEFFNIPPRPAGETQISVTYRYNEHGIVEVEAKDIHTNKTLLHRKSGLRFPVEKLLTRRAPAKIAIIQDCSGSLYGQSMEELREALEQIIHTHAQEDRKIAIFASPPPDDVLRSEAFAGPTHDKSVLLESIKNLIAIGATPIQQALIMARRSLKDLGRVFILLTDGHFDDIDAVQKEAEKLRKHGGRLVVIAPAQNSNKDALLSLVVSDSDLIEAGNLIDFNHKLINLVEETESV